MLHDGDAHMLALLTAHPHASPTQLASAVLGELSDPRNAHVREGREAVIAAGTATAAADLLHLHPQTLRYLLQPSNAPRVSSRRRWAATPTAHDGRSILGRQGAFPAAWRGSLSLSVSMVVANWVTVRARGCWMTQDAIQVAPDVYSVLFENDRVRLLQYHMQPGDNSAPHSHPSYLAYSLSDGTITFHTPSGESFDADMESGQTIWREAEDHSATNNGSSDVRGLLFELK